MGSCMQGSHDTAAGEPMNRNNGMRAWRRAARKWRHKQNRRSGAPRADGSGRWYRRQRAWFRQRPAVPHRPFTPRSLVGMSQRRRKQLYHQLFDTQTDPETIYSGTWSRGGLHIGERLRPCPGCTACLVCVACENNNCRRKHLPVQYCAGDGVLPPMRR